MDVTLAEFLTNPSRAFKHAASEEVRVLDENGQVRLVLTSGSFLDTSKQLYLVRDSDRWGFSLNVVRASSPEEAKKIVAPNSRLIEIDELSTEGPSGIIWSHDESPDSRR